LTVKHNHQKYQSLSSEYPFFEYQSYSFFLKNGNLEAEYCFNLADKYLFKPTIKIPIRKFYTLDETKIGHFSNFVFHIGMVELISYWKAACPPKVIIRPHNLDDKQIAWWKKLYFLGLGEFFYLNNITTDENSFMSIFSHGEKINSSNLKLDADRVIVPIGGGKDSVVTLELLTKSIKKVIPMIINPREASIATIETAGYNRDQSIIINRKIDGKLLELNELGFLNGHTPFSAIVAFTGVLSCAISGVANIALSNESSANQSTVPGSKINHQYSKTFEFEYDFDWYIKKYIHPGINYFSFLRPVNELQIAKMFSKYSEYFSSFKSCNVGSRTDSWCGECPKCLFTYIILCPFIAPDKLVYIFGKDLMNEISLSETFKELTGVSDVKPFECVGTPDEVLAALWKFSQQYQNNPVLLKEMELFDYKEIDYNKLISEYNTEHLIPEEFEIILKNVLND
jgi:hypothetical protein